MNHLSFEQVILKASGSAIGTLANEHVSTCKECADAVERERAFKESLKQAISLPTPSLDFSKKVMYQITRQQESMRALWAIVTAVTFTLFLVEILWFVLYTEPGIQILKWVINFLAVLVVQIIRDVAKLTEVLLLFAVLVLIALLMLQKQSRQHSRTI